MNLLIVQRRLTHYRVPFFERLKESLSQDDINLTLVIGKPNSEEIKKNDGGEISWAKKVPCNYFFKNKICKMDFSGIAKNNTHLILTQENKLIDNIGYLCQQKNNRTALWGHGKNFQSTEITPTLADGIKNSLSRRADWWFAYTELSEKTISDIGYPKERITILNNSIDTEKLKKDFQESQKKNKQNLKIELGLHPDAVVGIFIGSLYKEKLPELLIESCEKIKQKFQNFELVVVGDGPMIGFFQEKKKLLPWIHVLGTLKGTKKTDALACADVMLNPGLVGLGILDSFTTGTPIITTDCKIHSPEICYLKNKSNGLFVAKESSAVASAFEELMNNKNLYSTISKNCLISSDFYSLQKMVANFRHGVNLWKKSNPKNNK